MHTRYTNNHRAYSLDLNLWLQGKFNDILKSGEEPIGTKWSDCRLELRQRKNSHISYSEYTNRIQLFNTLLVYTHHYKYFQLLPMQHRIACQNFPTWEVNGFL